MANLNTLTFSQVVQQIATAAQAKAPLPFNLGSPELALAEADASVVMWLQSLIVDVLATTRASTSQGPDLDSWMADFGLTRLPATNATGTLTFSRYTATNAATIPVGTQVQSQDGAVTYAVIADTTQPLFSVALNAYLIPAGIASGNVTAQAVTPGAAGNVQIGVLTSLTSSIQNVDTVTNPAAITNGIDAESDAAFRNRFQLYLGSFEKGTKNAIAYPAFRTSILSPILPQLQTVLTRKRTRHFEIAFSFISAVSRRAPKTPLLMRWHRCSRASPTR